MVFEKEYRIQVRDTGKNNEITNKGVLSILEDIACRHSDKVGFGLYDIPKTNLTWVLLDWKLQVISRPKYGEEVDVKTWSRYIYKCYAYRDFEIYNKNGKLLAIATSRWVLIDVEKNKITKVEEYVSKGYESETQKSVFNIVDLDKLKEPEDMIETMQYTILRRDIDVYNHMHNLYYLDLAYEALPETVYSKEEFSNIRITYKKEIKLGDKVQCFYRKKEEKHIIVMKSQSTLHAIVELW